MRSLAIDSSLEGIAGPPLAMITVPNTSSSALDIGPTQARTLYAVGSTPSAQSRATAIANIGGSNNNGTLFSGAQVICSIALDIGGLSHRAQVIGGAAVSQDILPGWPWNRPLAVCGWWDGSAFGSQGYLSAPTVSAPAGGSMNASPRLRLAPIPADANTTPIAALAYRGVHDLATRTRILNWLMQRYGTT